MKTKVECLEGEHVHISEVECLLSFKSESGEVKSLLITTDGRELTPIDLACAKTSLKYWTCIATKII